MPLPGRELTDPSDRSPTGAPAILALAAIERDYPDEAELLRTILAQCEGERITYTVLNDAIRHMEQGTAARQRVADALERMRPAVERGAAALEAEIDVKRRAVAVEERAATDRHEAEVAGRTTALEHVRGAWTALGKAFDNKALIVAVSGGIGWLVPRLFEGLSAWLHHP